MVVDQLDLYLVTIFAFLAPWPLFWQTKKLSTGKMIFLLFCLDIALTIEGAFYGQVEMIALLHVFTIPAFFSIIYFDLRKQSNDQYRCFICGKVIEPNEEMSRVTRGAGRKNASVHESCIDLNNLERKRFSKKTFGKGIPH